MPYLAATYALEFFSKSIFMNFVEFQFGQMMRDKSDRQVSSDQEVCVIMSYRLLYICVCVCVFQADMGREIHAMGCSSKPLGSWTAQRGIQECREACGGHGFLASQSQAHRHSHGHAVRQRR